MSDRLPLNEALAKVYDQIAVNEEVEATEDQVTEIDRKKNLEKLNDFYEE